jgi:MFS family permease
MSDRNLIAAAGFLRACSIGATGVLLGLHLARLGFPPGASGLVIGAGLAGGALGTAVVATLADRLGRRRVLVGLALLGGAGTAAVAFGNALPALAAAAFLGAVNGMGRDRGAQLALEQAMVPAVAGDAARTRAFAVYNVMQDAGHALGALLAGLPALLGALAGVPEGEGIRVALLAAAALAAAGAPVYLRLTAGVEAEAATAPRRLSPESRRIVARISALFAVDSVAGGFLSSALLSYFFFERFGVGAGALGGLFFAARVANALSHLGAAWLAGRIGLVNTMVFTHMPSSLLLVTVAFAPTFPVAALLFLLREGLVEMDVPTRQSYVMAVVRPEERTRVSGVTGLVRLGGWAVGPPLAGAAMQGVSLLAPLVTGAAMKIAYDALLWAAFRRLKPPEERGGTGPGTE